MTLIQDLDSFISYANHKLSKNDDEAAERFLRYKSSDPFKDIDPALLNSVDIFKYVVATGLVHPFYPANLKGASYSARLLGDCRYWDNHGKLNKQELKEGEVFILHPNSVAFVTIEPKFRLPDYIAIRFNLKISHVYKGLLLGTGPLVDPGFEGRLSIPLHNFTLNPYKFYGGQELIWIEFTKLSKCEKWDNDANAGEEYRQLDGYYAEFPDRKKDEKLYKYIEDALSDVKKDKEEIKICVRNAIPEAIRDVEAFKNEVTSLYQDSKDVLNTFKNFGLIGTLVFFLGIMTLFFTTHSLVQDSNNYVSTSQAEVTNLINDYKRTIEAQNIRIEELKNEIDEYKSSINDLEEKVYNEER